MDAARSAAQRAEALGELVNGHPENVAAALPELEQLLQATWADEDAEGLWETISALGLAWDDRASALLLPLARAGHPDADVRQCLAWAFCTGVDSEPLRTEAIEVLRVMTRDPAAAVRDWSCFALALQEADDPRTCDAWAARLDDADLDTRCEALLGLAQAGDPRALDAVLAALTTDGVDVTLVHLEAAAALADPRLLPALHALQGVWTGEEDEDIAFLDRALRRCAPQAATHAARMEHALAQAAAEREAAGLPSVRLLGTWPRTRIQDVDAHGSPVVTHIVRRFWDTTDDPATASEEQRLGTWLPDDAPTAQRPPDR